MSRMRQSPPSPDLPARATSVHVTGLRGIPGVIGGVETHCEELMPRIAALAPELDIEVLGRRRFVEREPILYRGVKVRGLPSPLSSSAEAIGGTACAILHAWRAGAKAMHIHAIGPALLAPFARLLGMRVILTHHGRDYERAKWGWFARRMLRLGERLGVWSADRTIAVAPSLAAELQRKFPSRSARINYIPNGTRKFGAALDGAEVLARFGLRPGQYILSVGRLVPEKGFDYLIRAFRSSGTDRVLVIAGSAVHESHFSTELMKKASDQVRLIGNQPREVLQILYENADLFVLASYHEGLAISALEAAACGTPMLLSDIVANTDLALPPDCYFTAGDERELAAKLRLGGSEFAYDADEVRSRFDWEKIAEDTLAIYRAVLAESVKGVDRPKSRAAIGGSAA
jgi:glycosyltransferase involved in cell wall biosynthesis